MLDYLIFKEINELFASGQLAKGKRLLRNLQSRCIALKDEINMLKIRNQTLEEALFLSKNLFFENGCYWLRINGIRQGPFCRNCYDSEGGLMHLEKDMAVFFCPYCHERYPITPPAGSPIHHARIIYFAR